MSQQTLVGVGSQLDDANEDQHAKQERLRQELESLKPWAEIRRREFDEKGRRRKQVRIVDPLTKLPPILTHKGKPETRS